MGLTPDLYLLRHGQTEWNVQGRMQGRLDSALTPLGQMQARRQARLVRALPPDLQCWSSPAGRAIQTARIVFSGRSFAQDARLQEIDVGDFTGRCDAELRAEHAQIFAVAGLGWYDRTPGGENFAALEARVRSFLAELGGPAIIITHGITLRMIRLVAMGLPPSRIDEMPVLQGAVHCVSAARHRVIY